MTQHWDLMAIGICMSVDLTASALGDVTFGTFPVRWLKGDHHVEEVNEAVNIFIIIMGF